MPPPNRPLRHIDYFELKMLSEQQKKRGSAYGIP